MSSMTDFIRCDNDALKSLSRKDTETKIDIKNAKAGSEQSEEIKQARTSTVITDEQRESQEPMIADNTDDMRKIIKAFEEEDSSGTENDIGKWLDHLTKAVVDYWIKKDRMDLQN